MEIGNKTIAQLAEELNQIPFFEGLQPTQLIDRVSFFEKLDEKLISKLVEQALILQFPAGGLICRQGDYEDTFYIVLSGEVEVSTETQLKQSIMLGTLGKGDFFGEMGPISGQPRTATITAKTRAVVLQIPKAIFLEMLRRSPAIKKRIDQKYIERSLRTHLRQVALFSSLSDEILDQLARRVELISFRKGEVIIKEGDDGDCLYLVRGGFVKVSKGPLESEKILTYLREGSYFGEMALLKEEKRGANVVAMTNVEAVRVGKREFQEILAVHPEVARFAEETILHRNKQAEELQKDQKKARAISFVVKKGLAQAREVLVIDLNKCIGCDNCVAACADVRGHARIERRGSRLGRLLIPTSCFHCENPECLLCQFGGIVRDKDGEIHFTEFCTGCGGCARRCPYGNILVVKLGEKEPSGFIRKKREVEAETSGRKKKQIVVKCDMCAGRANMACVHNCPTGAMSVLTPEDLIAYYDS